MAKGNNKYGAAGRSGVPAATLVAFLDHYTYEGYNPTVQSVDHEPLRAKRINGAFITPSTQRAIRRWRNGQVEHVSTRGLIRILAEFGFDLPWFHGWAKNNQRPLR